MTVRPVAFVSSSPVCRPRTLRKRVSASRQPNNAPPEPPMRLATRMFGPDGEAGGTAGLSTRTSGVSLPTGCATVCCERSSSVW